VSLRARIILYLVVLHISAAAAVAYLAGASPAWLIGVEVAFVASLAAGITLANRFIRSLEVGAEAARLMRDGELTARLRPTGDREIDPLIEVYNRMVDALRGERVRLQEQHHFLAQVLGASPSGFVILDFDGRVTELNPAAVTILGVPRERVLGQPLGGVPGTLAPVLAHLAPGETQVVGLAGARRLRCYRGRFMDRGFARAFVVLEELTEEARQFERAAYEKLIRVMSHEVNNSVTASNSLLQSSLTYAAELQPDSRADLELALGIVIDRTDQLNRFMRRFADVFRLAPPLREPTELSHLLESLVRLLAARPEWGAVHWSWRVEPELPLVKVDRAQFEQACLNVLKNAVEAAGPAGRVEVSLTSGDDGVLIQVADSGPGLSPEAQSHIFTPFFSTKPNGQGIGLTLVQEILTAHGFGYGLERPEHGVTVFTIRIPAVHTTPGLAPSQGLNPGADVRPPQNFKDRPA
jgi:signal transduction histidine kinase